MENFVIQQEILMQQELQRQQQIQIQRQQEEITRQTLKQHEEQIRNNIFFR